MAHSNAFDFVIMSHKIGKIRLVNRLPNLDIFIAEVIACRILTLLSKSPQRRPLSSRLEVVGVYLGSSQALQEGHLHDEDVFVPAMQLHALQVDTKPTKPASGKWEQSWASSS